MTSDIAALVQAQLGESMPDAAWQAVASMWSLKRLEDAHPEEESRQTSGLSCKSCKKGHKCRWKGKKGHLPTDPATAEEPERNPEAKVNLRHRRHAQ